MLHLARKQCSANKNLQQCMHSIMACVVDLYCINRAYTLPKANRAMENPKSRSEASCRGPSDNGMEVLMSYWSRLRTSTQLNTKHLRVLDRELELKGHRFSLHIDWDSLKTFKETGTEIFTGLTLETVQVVSDPDADLHKKVLQWAQHPQDMLSRRDGLLHPSAPLWN
jgi:hypothetical protein